MNKQTESLARQEFEKWFSEKYPLKKPSVRKLKLWQAWEACLDSLVVEMPEKSNVTAGIDMIGMAARSGRNKGIEESEGAIRAIGIRIKGEGV